MKRFSDAQKYVFFGAIIIFLLLGLESTIARYMLAIILVLMASYIIRAFNHLNRPVVNGLFLLLVLNVIYYTFSDKVVRGNWETTGFFANIVMVIGVFFFSYFLAQKKQLSEKEMKWLFLLMYLADVIRFFITRDMVLSGRGGMNMTYDFVILLPYLYLFRHKWIPMALSLPIAYFVAYGGKRGAIVLFLLSFFLLCYHFYFKRNNGSFIVNSITIGIVIIGGSLIIYNVYQESSLLQWRLEMTMEGDTSGRDYIFAAILNGWLNSSNILYLLFGYGFCASVEFTGNYAHNDWLELLSMSGILGVMIYGMFFYQLYNFTKRKVYIYWQRMALYMILFIWFVKSFFSMSYCMVGNMPITLLLGFFVGTVQRNYDNQIITNKIK